MHEGCSHLSLHKTVLMDRSSRRLAPTPPVGRYDIVSERFWFFFAALARDHVLGSLLLGCF